MQSLPSRISQSFWGENIKEGRSAAEFRSESHHCRLARSGKVSCMRDALMRVWSLGRFQLERRVAQGYGALSEEVSGLDNERGP